MSKTKIDNAYKAVEKTKAAYIKIHEELISTYVELAICASKTPVLYLQPYQYKVDFHLEDAYKSYARIERKMWRAYVVYNKALADYSNLLEPAVTIWPDDVVIVGQRKHRNVTKASINRLRNLMIPNSEASHAGTIVYFVYRTKGESGDE